MRRIAQQDVGRILDAVEQLVLNPYPPSCVKLSGSDQAFRIRVGDYRVIYEVFQDVLMIEVIKIGHRRDVYQ